MGQDEKGHQTRAGCPYIIAWFKDPAGNTLGRCCRER